MTIPELIKICQIRLDYLSLQKNSYIQLGDFDTANKIDVEILDTQNTLNFLKTNSN
jgi:hypothetical protein